MAIEAEHYEETRKRLIQDPIVRAMAEGCRSLPIFDIAHVGLEGPLTPRFEFMNAANQEYRTRGGKDSGHIGAIAEAIIRILEGE